MAIQYTDGQKVEAKILEYLQKTSNLDSSSDPMQEEYSNWAVRYHLSSKRSNLLRHLNFSELDVLEVGAEMGGISRFLAEESKSLYVVEGTQARYNALCARLNGLTNWSGSVLNFQDFQTNDKFDVVCLIGVLEYSPLYIYAGSKDNPFDIALQIAKRHLKPGGAIIIAIENQLGLKYWNGAPEDHTSRMFDGITGYGAKDTPRTLSRQNLLRLLQHNGFGKTEEFYPFPDYKMPSAILHSNAMKMPSEVIADLVCIQEFESYSVPRQPLFPDYLAALELSRSGLIAELSNSFLFVAFTEGDESIKKNLLSRLSQDNEQAWLYGSRKNSKTFTSFTMSANSWQVSKTMTSLWNSSQTVHWRPLREVLVHGIAVRELLERSAYHGQWDIFIEELHSFLQWTLTSKTYIKDNQFLVDAVWMNARKIDSGYQLFDQEWVINSNAPLSATEASHWANWILFRNIFTLERINYYWDKSRPWKNLKELYEFTCHRFKLSPNYTEYLQNEAEFQGEVYTASSDHFKAIIDHAMTRKIYKRPFVTSPSEWRILLRYFPFWSSKTIFLTKAEKRIRNLLRH